MDDLSSLMNKRGLPTQPTEVVAIKRWCSENYPGFEVVVQKRTHDYMITVPSATLSSEIHMRMLELKTYAKIDSSARITLKFG